MHLFDTFLSCQLNSGFVCVRYTIYYWVKSWSFWIQNNIKHTCAYTNPYSPFNEWMSNSKHVCSRNFAFKLIAKSIAILCMCSVHCKLYLHFANCKIDLSLSLFSPPCSLSTTPFIFTLFNFQLTRKSLSRYIHSKLKHQQFNNALLVLLVARMQIPHNY